MSAVDSVYCMNVTLNKLDNIYKKQYFSLKNHFFQTVKDSVFHRFVCYHIILLHPSMVVCNLNNKLILSENPS